ncbi:hypothetical protein [Nocardia jinanensis]|uniref:hypothetical protein n=1 Tax=Nocardia jinanensis TaxID=382504 RepID=UPI00166BD631|nr:hypothetical protein [Nocardia jinanensis]
MATESGFRISVDSALRHGRLIRYERTDNDSLLRVMSGIPADQVLAEALEELEQAAQQRQWLPPVAPGPKTYISSVYLGASSGRQEFRTGTFLVPDVPVGIEPIHLSPSPERSALTLDFDTLRIAAKEIDAAGTHGFSLYDVLDGFAAGLRTSSHSAASSLDLRAGPLNLLVAPTGSGKSIFMRVAASSLAREGNSVLLVTPGVEDTLALAEQIEGDLRAVGSEAEVVALMSPRRLIEVAEQRANDATEVSGDPRRTWDRLGYSCLLPVIDGPPWEPGQEPCTNLRVPDEEQRYRCPLISVCEKWRPWRRAAESAKVIVTNHAYFQSGSVPVPVTLNGRPRPRITVQEFLLQRADVVMIDEIDAFQAQAVENSGRTLVLARRDSEDLLLGKLDRQRREQVFAGTVPAELELDFQRIMKRLDYIPERYLAAVVHKFIDPADPIRSRHRPRLHIPRRWDNLLACRLCGLDERTERPTDAQLDSFESLFHQREPKMPLPEGWGVLREELRAAVSMQPSGDQLADRRDAIRNHLVQLEVQEVEQTAELMLRRVFLGEIHRDLASLEQRLPLMRDAGMRLADEVEATLDRGSSWQATPEGPIGRTVFGFATTGDPDRTDDRTLTTEIISGDPHVYTAELGRTTAAALTGAPRIVLALSATAYLPESPTLHVHAPVRWYYPDHTDHGTGKVTIRSSAVTGLGGTGIVFSGAPKHRKPELMNQLGFFLWQQTLEDHLDRLHNHADTQRRSRARVLLVVNSYNQGVQLARGLIRAGAARSRVCLAVPAASEGRRDQLELPSDVHVLPANRLKDFPNTGADVLISPFARVARGLNIVVENKSALDSIWVCVRPIKLIDRPAALVAHTGAKALLGRDASDQPAAELAERHELSASHLELINRANPAFSRLPRIVRVAVFADVFGDLNQLIGRARRGGTDTTLYLVDNAFNPDGSAPGSSFHALFTHLYHSWERLGEIDTVRQIYGTTLDAFVRFALPTTRNR